MTPSLEVEEAGCRQRSQSIFCFVGSGSSIVALAILPQSNDLVEGSRNDQQI